MLFKSVWYSVEQGYTKLCLTVGTCMMVSWKTYLGNTFQPQTSKLSLSVSDMDFEALTGGLRVTYWIVSE